MKNIFKTYTAGEAIKKLRQDQNNLWEFIMRHPEINCEEQKKRYYEIENEIEKLQPKTEL